MADEIQTTKQPTPGEWLREEHPEAWHASAEESTPAMDHDNRSPRTTTWIGGNLRITLLIFGIVSYLFGIHPGGEIMVIAAVGLISWRDYP